MTGIKLKKLFNGQRVNDLTFMGEDIIDYKKEFDEWYKFSGKNLKQEFLIWFKNKYKNLNNKHIKEKGEKPDVKQK